MATYYTKSGAATRKKQDEEDVVNRPNTQQATETQPAQRTRASSISKLDYGTTQPKSVNAGNNRNQSATMQAASNLLKNGTAPGTNLAQQYGGAYQATSANGGNPYQIGSDKGIDFVQNAATGASMIGGDGSQWYKNPDGSVTITTKGGNTYSTPGYRTMAEGNADLQAQYQDLFDQMNNYAPFSYDPAVDPLYQNYKKQYTREGQRAMQDTMGQYAAMTGGLPSTAAMTAASQANDYYMAQMADKIPELYKLAYNMYVDDYNRLADRYDLAYQQFNDDLANNWKGLYNQQDMAQQRWSNQMAEDEYNYQKTLDAWDQDYKNRLLDWDQETYNQDRAWDREQFYAELEANNAYRNASIAQDAAELAEKRRQYDAKQAAAAAETAAVQQRSDLQAAARQAAQNTINAGMNVAMGKAPATTGTAGLLQTAARTGGDNVLQQAAAAAATAAAARNQGLTVDTLRRSDIAKMGYDEFLSWVDKGYEPTKQDAEQFGLSAVNLKLLQTRALAARKGKL